MYNIRIKQLPKNGDQRNYSLVDRNDLYIKTNPVNSDSNVKNTISAVPRDEANIEAEGGETVIGDINNDGFLEHSKIVGKRHTEGGVPLNIAPGSFIFSDTKKLKIKDPEVLSIFGINKVPKGGVTPAKIAQKYPMNNFMNTLKDDKADPISKRTASQMMKNNLEKLGMLALVQESMKGFPDGIPAIAESVMAGMQGMQMPGQEQGEGVAHEVMEGNESQGEMRYGGGYYQNAGTTKEKQKNKITSSGNPVVGFKFYNGITPVTVTKLNNNYAIENPNSPYIELSDGQRLTKKQFDQLLTKGFYNNIQGGIGDVYTINQNIQKRTIYDSDGKPVEGFDLYSGDKFNYKGNDYTVVNPYGDNSRGYYDTSKPLRDMFDNTQGIIHVRNNKTGQYEFIEAEDLGDAYKFDKNQVPISPNQSFRNAFPNAEKIRITNPGYEIAEPEYNKQKSQKEVYTPATQNVENKNFEGAQALDTSSTKKIPVKETYNSAPSSESKKQTATASSKPVVKKVAATVETRRFVVPNGKYKGQEAFAVKRGDTLRINYPDGNHETYINNKFVPGFANGGSLPKHQGNIPGVSSTVGEGTLSIDDLNSIFNNGNVKEVDTKNPNGKVIANATNDFQVLPASVKSLPFTPKDANTFEPWHSKNYDTVWKPMAEQAMMSPEGAEAINSYLSGLVESNAFGPNIAKQLEGLSGQERYDKILSLATDGKPGPFHNAFLQAMINAPKKETPIVEEQLPVKKDIEVKTLENKPVVKRRRPWWIQDIMNYAAAMTDNVNYYPPAMSQVDLETPGYVLLDPDRQIAAMQEQAARQQEGAYNTTAGNVAGASIVGQSDRALGAAANIIAGVENQNASIVNQAFDRVAQINNQEKMLNENAKQNYIGQSATARQNYDNALRDLKYRQLRAWNNGTTNWMRHKQMEDVLFPNVGIDSITGDVYFPGGREAFDAQGKQVYDPYINPAGSGSSNNKYDASDYITLFNKLRSENPGISDEQVDAAVKYQLTGKFVEQPQNMYANAMAAGMTLPQQGRYGGKVKKQYGGVVLEFGALPMYFFED